MIYSQVIEGPGAWLGSNVKKEDLAFDLSPRNVAALKEILERCETSGLSLADIDRATCRHPDLDDDLHRLLQIIQKGSGLAIVRGFPIQGYSDEQVGMLSWILGTHLGKGVSQSVLGNLLGYVRDLTPPNAPKEQSARGHLGRRELKLHTDGTQIMGLICVRQGITGGESQFTSALAIHNKFLANRPDLLPVLYKGWPQHRRAEEQDGQDPITPYDVPVFCNVDGNVSMQYSRDIFDLGVAGSGRTYSAAEEEAHALIRQYGEELQFETRLEPGEIAIANNLTMMHARSIFKDHEALEKKRLMIRLWLDADHDARPTVRELWRYENKNGRSGVDPVPGRVPAPPKFRVDH
jgi:hypothetical protein